MNANPVRRSGWRRHMAGRAALLTLAFLAGGCATNPVTKKSELSWVWERQEIQLGQQNYGAYKQAEGGEYVLDPAVQAYVRGVAQKVWTVSDRADMPYEIVVLNNNTPNAWALPGGKMAINRGLLTELRSESELASVLAHETVHVAARHGARSIQTGQLLQIGALGVGLATQDQKYSDVIMQGTGLAAGLTSLKYSRSHELEADKYGIAYLSRAGYDVQSAVDLQALFLSFSKDPGWVAGFFSSHPPSRERMEANQETIKKYAPGGEQGRDTYAKAMAGLMADKAAYEKLEKGQAALQTRKDAATALALAQQAIAIEPREAHFHALAGKAYTAQHAYPQALESLNEAIRLNKHYFEYYLDRGQVRQAMGDGAGAKVDVQQSAQLLPTANAHYMLGVMAMDGGSPAAAVEHFRAAATSESAEGEKSGVLLAKLDMGAHPERYLRVGVGLDGRGFVVIGVQNTSPVDVDTCIVEVASPRSGGWQRYAFPNGVRAHREAAVPTRVGPFASLRDAQAAVRYRFVNVTVAGAPASGGRGNRWR